MSQQMVCSYENCPAFKINAEHKQEIDQLILGVKALTKGQQNHDAEMHQQRMHHNEIMLQQTRNSADITLIHQSLENQKADRNEKYNATLEFLKELRNDLLSIKEDMHDVSKRQDTQEVDMKSINYKMYVIWAVASGIAFTAWTKIKSLLGL